MEVCEVGPGLWRWSAAHPGWTPADPWGPEVGSVYCESGGEIGLIDPVVPAAATAAERFWRALDRDVERLGAPHIVLTVPWHARGTAEIVARYPGARLWVHRDGRRELAERVEATDTFAFGDALPAGIVARPAGWGVEAVLWLPQHGAIASGDVLLGAGGALTVPADWIGDSLGAVREALEGLLGLSVERVLVAHGDPVLRGGRAALAHALAAAG